MDYKTRLVYERVLTHASIVLLAGGEKKCYQNDQDNFCFHLSEVIRIKVRNILSKIKFICQDLVHTYKAVTIKHDDTSRLLKW